MSIEPSDFNRAGERILSGATCEADLRTAIGRFYYSAFHHCKDFHEGLASPGSSQVTNGMHSILCSQLANPTLPRTDALNGKSKRLGYMLRVFHAQRIKADYVLDANVDSDDAASAQLQAKTILAI